MGHSPLSHPKYVPAFDGIRGVAVIGVMLFHYIGIVFGAAWNPVSPTESLAAKFFRWISVEGWVGVPVFFALSGFLITGILCDSWDDKHFFKNFYARRTLRIFPLYYGILACLFVMTLFLHFNWGPRWWVFLVYLQGTLHTNFVPHPYANLTNFWTLAIEEQFYLLWPLGCFLIKDKKRLILIASAGSIVSLIFRFWLVSRHNHAATAELRYYLPSNLDSLLIGSVGALLLRTRYARKTLKLGPYLFIGGLIPLICEAIVLKRPLSFEREAFTFTWGLFFLSLSSVGLLLWTYTKGGTLSQALSLGPLRFVGKYSYGIYAIHHLPMLAAIPISLRIQGIGVGKPVANLLASGGMMAGSVVCAVIVFHLYEKPFLRLKRYFIYEETPKLQDPELEDPQPLKPAA